MATAATQAPQGSSRGSTKSGPGISIIIFSSLMLFSMFFGAGNLIFPPMLGVQSGENFWPAILGFVGSGVILPVLAIIAIAISGHSVRDLAARGGAIFGLVFSLLAYLSIGAFYALPRTAAVSFETAITPILGFEGTAANWVFCLIFFGVALALAWRPTTIMDTLGRILTPALTILLVILVISAITGFDAQNLTASEEYSESAFTTGLLEGYLTMDSIAGLAFGIVIISTLRTKGFSEGGQLVRGTITTGIIAGAFLAVIYIGLGYIGQMLPGAADQDSGAAILSAAAESALGTPGQIIWAFIVLLACMTTAVGLISSTSEFFSTLTPQMGYRTWAIIFTVISLVLAAQGLDFVLDIAVPIIIFLYPPAITLIFLTLIEPIFGGKVKFYFTFRLGLWTAVVWSAIMVAVSQGAEGLEPIIGWTPLHGVNLGWLLPVIVAVIIGVILDMSKPRKASAQSPVRREVAHEA